MSVVESAVTTVATGTGAIAANYFVLPAVWGLHPTMTGSFGMALFFGLLSFGIKIPIRRVFNAIR